MAWLIDEMEVELVCALRVGAGDDGCDCEDVPFVCGELSGSE
jgi:hypothetical protein